jgi:hypothetical protein
MNGSLVVGGRIILKWIFTWSWRMFIVFIWLRIGALGQLL